MNTIRPHSNSLGSLVAALLLLVEPPELAPGIRSASTSPRTVLTQAEKRAAIPPIAIRQMHTGDTAQSKLVKLNTRDAFTLAQFLREYKSGLISDYGKQYIADEDLVKRVKGDPTAVLIVRHFEFYKQQQRANNYLDFLAGGKLNTDTALQLINLRMGSLIPRTFYSLAKVEPSKWLALEESAYKAGPNSVRQAIKENHLKDPKEFWHQIAALATFGAHGDDAHFCYSRFLADQNTTALKYS